MIPPKPVVGVDAWLRAIKASNPFVSNAVTTVDDSSADVASINRKQFRRITKRIDEVREGGDTAGVLLVGAAGLGKSHLLARVFRWAQGEGRAVVVYLHNVLASPERLPRYLLRATVSTLAGHQPSAYPESGLYALINRAIQPELAKGSKGIPSLTKRLKALAKLGKDIDPHRLVMPAFTGFLTQAIGASQGEPEAERLAQAAVQWLSGEVIEQKMAESLGLTVNAETGAHIPDDEGVERALLVIARLCGKVRRPFVLCVDQVDNLDDDKVTAVSAFLQALLDNGQNLVVITSGVRDSMLQFQRTRVIPQAAWDRLAKHRVELDPISPDEARAMVKARVLAFSQPFKDSPELSELLGKDPLLPLGSTWVEGRFAKVIDVRPRDVIDWSRVRWDDEQETLEEQGDDVWIAAVGSGRRQVQPVSDPPPANEKQAIADVVAKKLKQAQNHRALKPESLPPDADNLATLAHQLLQHCVGSEAYSLREIERISAKKGPVTYDIAAKEETPDGSSVTNGLKFLTDDNARSVVWTLKRFKNDAKPPTHRLLVTDEDRRPLKLGKAGREIYEELTKSGALEHIKLTFDDYARLDAMSVVLGSARVGDLEVGIGGGRFRSVTEAECLAAMHQHGVFLQHPLLHELLTEERAVKNEGPRSSGLDKQMVRQRIVAELQWRLGMTGREMALIILEREKLARELGTAVHQLVLDEAKALHSSGHVCATAQDDDLFVQLLKKVAK